MPPVNANVIRQNPDGRTLTADEIAIDQVVEVIRGGTFVYEVPYAAYRDYENLRQQAAVQVMSNPNSWMVKILETPFPGIIPGTYKMKLMYRLPGTNTVTSQQTVTMKVE